MKITIRLAIILVIVAGSFNISARFETDTFHGTFKENKALLRKWTYVMVEVPSVREMLSHASNAESQLIKDQYAKAYKGTYLKFNEDNTFEIRKSPNAQPSKGTWRYDADNDRKLYMKEDTDEKEQETYIAKLNRKQLILTNGKEANNELVQIFLVPFDK
ncbi:hypothetical protein BKI52_09315 [marine bacterium AO1-C]|nr:hypothetical protein BKI52_09315 [marine bacterium AO1-C]